MTGRATSIVLFITTACILGVCGELELPDSPFWHFAVRSTDKSATIIVFSKHWKPPSSVEDIPITWYHVEKSTSQNFDGQTFDQVQAPIVDLGNAYMMLDAPWSNSNAPYYRVVIRESETNEIAASSPGLPLENEGAIFVTQPPASDSVASETCGELAISPCLDIKSAIQQATDGATIYVGPGVYFGPGNTNISFGGKNLRLQSTNGMNLTMINCTDPVTGDKTRAFVFDSGESRQAMVQGFTITGGLADEGGCMYIVNGSPTISECLFFDCQATTGIAWGGAIYSFGNPEPGPLINNSAFIYNMATEGAGIYVGGDSKVTIENSLFEWGISASATGRGGGICADVANVTVTNTRMQNNNVGFGGGAVMLERSTGIFDRVSLFNNSAGSFGGAVLLFGADMKISNSEMTYNKGLIFAGGVIITTSSYDAVNTIHNSNYGRGSGGAIQLVGGKLRLKGCQMNDNLSGGDGAGLYVTNQKELGAVYTDALIEDSEIMNNVAKRMSGGFHLDAYDQVVFRNVKVGNNSAERGGGGGCDADSSYPSYFDNVLFEFNRASLGGGFYATSPCRANMTGTIFSQNSASEAGAGLAVGDGVQIEVDRSIFEGNGFSQCQSGDSPTVGGGIMIGVEEFDVSGQCDATTETEISTVNLRDTIIIGNTATEKGGGIFIEQGLLNVTGVEIQQNYAIGAEDDLQQGVGGGIAIAERCLTSSQCSTAMAIISRSKIFNNRALRAGGGLFFSGGSREGQLVISESVIASNEVSGNFTESNALEGVGGGLFIGRSNASLHYISVLTNKAFYGGGIFFSTNLSSNEVSLNGINSTANNALLGSAAYWLRSASPNHHLPLEAFYISPNDANSISTEVLKIQYSTLPPTLTESGSPTAPFSVEMLDYYGNVAISEFGTCKVIDNNQAGGISNISSVMVVPDSSNLESYMADYAPPQIRPLGAEVSMRSGKASFVQLEISGKIGAVYDLDVSCTSASRGRSQFLQLTGEPLPALTLPLELAPCSPGSAPESTSTGEEICVECPFNTYSMDGLECQPCPEGAVCSGGKDISSRLNWWRSSENSTEFYSCLSPDICQAGPQVGDEACVEGHQGPLCGVCYEDWFFFAGRCRSCDRSDISKGLLALAITLAIVVFILIFARSWEFGDPASPGIMTKIKILLAHFQILALLRDYDVLWPEATSESFSWFDLSNFGMGMIAPSCSVGSSYSFWMKWIVQMAMPVLAVSFCGAVYWIADWSLRRRVRRNMACKVSHCSSSVDQEVQNQYQEFTRAEESGSCSQGCSDENLCEDKYSQYLSKLKIRCWKNAFWLLTLLYPASSMTALQMFATTKLDTGTYLKADLSIMVKPPGEDFTNTYKAYMGPGAIFLFLLALGLPGSWWLAVWKNRKRLEEREVALKYGFLYGSYSRKYPFWEPFEALRKFVFALIPVFFPANSAGSIQGVVGQIWAIIYAMLIIALHPFAQTEDNYLTCASIIVIWLVLLSGSAAKWAALSDDGMKGLAAAQLFLSSGLVFAIVTIVALSIWSKFKKRKSRSNNDDGEECDTIDKDNDDNNSKIMLKKHLSKVVAKVMVKAGSVRGSDQIPTSVDPKEPLNNA